MNVGSYSQLTGEAEYRQAIDTVLLQAERELAIFDHDLTSLRLEEPARIAMLTDFLQRSPNAILRIVVHDAQPMNTRMPRFMKLAMLHSTRIQARGSPGNLHHLADTHCLGDQCHGVRRFHRDHARCALILDDPAAIQPWQKRFEELWGLSQPCLNINTTGL
jgi:hypothetical protein